jgi:hypothetical protein
MVRTKGPHDAYLEVNLTIRVRTPSMSTPSEAEAWAEQLVQRLLDARATILGGDLVEKEILNVAAEPSVTHREAFDEVQDEDDD